MWLGNAYTVQTSNNLNDTRVLFACDTRVVRVDSSCHFLRVASHACVSVIDTQVHAHKVSIHATARTRNSQA